jgi:hypothetical protein
MTSWPNRGRVLRPALRSRSPQGRKPRRRAMQRIRKRWRFETMALYLRKVAAYIRARQTGAIG